MKIGIIQPSVNAGEFSRNVRSLIENYRLCLDQGADIVIAPAQSLCGPGLGDLLLRSSYGRQNLDALNYLSTETGNVPLLVGTISCADDENAWGFYNAVYVVRNNHIEELAAQQFMSDEGTSRDSRYFIPSGHTGPVKVDGVRIGALIGADDPNSLEPGACDLIIRFPSSPWSIGELEANLDDDIFIARKHQAPVARVNLAGGLERSLYAGGSTLVNEKGELLKRLKTAVEDCLVIDSDASAEDDHLPCLMEQVRKMLVMGIRDYITQSGFGSVCLGLSGGLDSALVAALAVEALGEKNVHGLAMPSQYSSQGSIDDAYALAANLGISCQTVGFATTFNILKESMLNVFAGAPEDITEENMQARIRGIILMSFSNKFGHLVLSTGNKSEASVGFCTMYGDTCGALLPIGDLYKTEVYALSRHINETSTRGEIIPDSTLAKPPSAELRPGQTDQDSLPPYEILDEILRELVENSTSATDLIAMGRFEEATVRRVQRLLKISEWKRAQAPPILSVSSCAFGPGRIIPSTYKFND